MRAAGHVLGEHGWEIAEDDKPEPKPEPEPEIDVDAYATGGGWYEIDGQKVQGKEAARSLLEQ